MPRKTGKRPVDGSPKCKETGLTKTPELQNPLDSFKVPSRASRSEASLSQPPWALLNWKTIKKPVNPVGKTGVTIMLPFSDVDVEDIPDIVNCFGGPAKIVAAAKHPQDKNKKLSFSMFGEDSGHPKMGLQPVKLSAVAAINSFLLEMHSSPRPESDEEMKARAKRELTAVERALNTDLCPLPPVITDVNFLYSIKSTFEFEKLFDFAMCPAVVNRTPKDPTQVELTSLVLYLLPSFPIRVPPVEPKNYQDYLYFPAAKFTNLSSFSGHGCIPSLYTDSLASHEKSVIRVRKAHTKTVKWSNGDFQIPAAADVDALKNLKDKVPADIRQRADQLLTDQMIWSRKEFYLELARLKPGLRPEHKRFILAGLAYRFSNGPWTMSWCRFGYDPRKDPDSRKFQVVDFRINHAFLRSHRTITKKSAPTERSTVLKSIIAKITKNTSQAAAAACVKGFQFMVSLKDMSDILEMNAILHSQSYWTDKCDSKEGFFKQGAMELLRLELSKAILREEPALALKNPAIVRQFQSVGMFGGVTLPQVDPGNDSDDDEDSEQRTADLEDVLKDTEMEHLTDSIMDIIPTGEFSVDDAAMDQD